MLFRHFDFNDPKNVAKFIFSAAVGVPLSAARDNVFNADVGVPI